MKSKSFIEMYNNIGYLPDKEGNYEPFEDFIKTIEKYSFMYFCLLSI